MKYFSHLNSAAALVRMYHGEQPFHHFIKVFFRQHKKYGSKDRKNIAQLAYCCFRLGHALLQKTAEERILAGLFLCSQGPNELLEFLQPQWNQQASASLKEKCAVIGVDISALSIFPWVDLMSDGIDAASFNLSHLQQPGFFIRIRPGHRTAVIKKLEAAAISYQLKSDMCIALPPVTNIEAVLEINKEAVVQDYSSQRIAALLSAVSCPPSGCKVWDCCAASGGKSILALDILKNIELTVTDVRPSILANLGRRFSEAGIIHYKSLVADLSGHFRLPATGYGLIIADVPCTGSGTWGRTPEQLVFFDQNEINRYQMLQQRIVAHAVPYLQHEGYFLYITCSVFRQENEDMVRYIQSTTSLTLIQAEVLKGYMLGADTMFAALFVKKS